MEDVTPFSIDRKDITRIVRNDEAFIIYGRGGSIVIPREVDYPLELQWAIGEMSCGLGESARLG